MSRIEDLSAITTPSLTDLLYIYQNGSDFKVTNQQLLDLIKTNTVIPITQADYDLLPSADKNNGAIYIITDTSVTINDISGADTFIHDMSFASSFDSQSELAINEVTDGLGQKKIYISQLRSLIQMETEIDDLKNVVTSQKADGDILVWNSQGGISGNGGWENKQIVAKTSIDVSFNAVANGFSDTGSRILVFVPFPFLMANTNYNIDCSYVNLVSQGIYTTGITVSEKYESGCMLIVTTTATGGNAYGGRVYLRVYTS